MEGHQGGGCGRGIPPPSHTRPLGVQYITEQQKRPPPLCGNHYTGWTPQNGQPMWTKFDQIYWYHEIEQLSRNKNNDTNISRFGVCVCVCRVLCVVCVCVCVKARDLWSIFKMSFTPLLISHLCLCVCVWCVCVCVIVFVGGGGGVLRVLVSVCVRSRSTTWSVQPWKQAISNERSCS